MDTVLKIIGAVLGSLIIAIILGLLCAFPVMLLWNWIMPLIIPGITQLTVIQAWGLMILCAFLFKPSIIKSN